MNTLKSVLTSTPDTREGLVSPAAAQAPLGAQSECFPLSGPRPLARPHVRVFSLLQPLLFCRLEASSVKFFLIIKVILNTKYQLRQQEICYLSEWSSYLWGGLYIYVFFYKAHFLI